MTEGEGIRVEMTRFHKYLLAHNHEGTRAVGRGGGVVSGRSLAAFIGCGRASTVTGEREWGSGKTHGEKCAAALA